MKRHLITGALVLVAGLFLANYLFSAIPDKEWKQAQAEFMDAYNKAKTPAERAIAIRKLAETDHPGIVKVLVDTVLPRELKENELLNVDIVATSLSKLSDPIAVDELITATKKTKLPEKVILIQSLGKISADGAKGLLLELLKNNDNLIKIAAIDALAELSPPEALDTVLGFMESKSWEVKVSAISYLAKLKDDEAKKKALEVLRKKLNKETGRLRNDISEAINQLMVQTSDEGDNNKMGGTFSFFDIPLEGDVVFVIDASTSMEGKNKDGKDRWDKLMEQLKQSLEVMAKAKPAVKFNIIAYSEKVGKFQDGLVPAADNKDAALKWLDSVKPGTMMAPGKLGAYTNIYDAVEMALLGQSAAATQGGQKIVITSGVPNPYSICLMTDGTANRGKYTVGDDILAALRILNQTRKIRINTIALDFGVSEAMGATGMGQMYAVDAALMEQIAKEHNGTCKKF